MNAVADAAASTVTDTVTAHVAWIGLGANLGDARAVIEQALADIASSPAIQSCSASPFYKTAPIDADGPFYVNAVARLHTTLAPMALLDTLQAIEQRHGRERPYRHAPRTLDLDLLLYDDAVMDTERLTLPHPRMHQRAFVLRPLRDLAPSMRLMQGGVADLLTHCADQHIERL